MLKQVALVSGDPDFALKSRDLLAGEHLELQVFEPGEFAPTWLQQNRPDVMLVDIGGKGTQSEFEIIRSMRCREHLRRIPVIAILEDTSRDMILSVHQAGIRDIVAKDGDQDALMEKVLKYCEAARHRPVLSQSRETGGRQATAEWSDPATTAFKKQVMREVNRRLETLPSLPMVVIEVMQLVESEKSSASDFEEYIGYDPALAARILRIANSSFFGLRRTIKSIRDAIVILGFQTLKSLVMAASTSKLLNKPAEGYGYLAGGLWKHSIACAVGSRLLAGKLGHGGKEAEVFFVQGLLHDIGKLLLNNFAVEKVEALREAMEVRKLSLLEAEQLVMGTDHCQVGTTIAERWNLPREIASAIAYHENPRRASADLRKQTIPIHVVNHWCHQLEVGMVPQTFVKNVLDQKAVQEIGLSESAFRDHRETFSAQLKKMEELFSMIGQE